MTLVVWVVVLIVVIRLVLVVEFVFMSRMW